MTNYACFNVECEEHQISVSERRAARDEYRCFSCGQELTVPRWQDPADLASLVERLPQPLAIGLQDLLQVPTTEHDRQVSALCEVIRRVFRFLGLYLFARYLEEGNASVQVDKAWRNEMTKADEGNWFNFIGNLAHKLLIENDDPVACLRFSAGGDGCPFDKSRGRQLLSLLKSFRNKWAHPDGKAKEPYKLDGSFDQAGVRLKRLLDDLGLLWDRELVGVSGGVMLVARGTEVRSGDMVAAAAGLKDGHVYLRDPLTGSTLDLFPGLIFDGVLRGRVAPQQPDAVLMFLEQRISGQDKTWCYQGGPKGERETVEVRKEFTFRRKEILDSAKLSPSLSFDRIREHAATATGLELELLEASKKILGEHYVRQPQEEEHLLEGLSTEVPSATRPLIVVTAPAGSGKTALLCHVAREAGARKYGPVLLARCLAIKGADLPAAICDRLRLEKEGLDDALRRVKRRQKRLLVILDGLNEHPEKSTFLENILLYLQQLQRNPDVADSVRVLVSWRTEEQHWVERALVSAGRQGDQGTPHELLRLPPAEGSGHLEGEFTSLRLRPWSLEKAAKLWERLTEEPAGSTASGPTFALTAGLTWESVASSRAVEAEVLQSPLYMRLLLETYHDQEALPDEMGRAHLVRGWLRGVRESLEPPPVLSDPTARKTFLQDVARIFLEAKRHILDREDLERDPRTSAGFVGGPFESLYAQLRDRRGVLLEIGGNESPQVNFSMDIFFEQIAARAILEDLEGSGGVTTERVVEAYLEYRRHPLIEGVMRALLEERAIDDSGPALLFGLIDHEEFEEPRALGQLLAGIFERNGIEAALEPLFDRPTDHDTVVLIEAVRHLWAQGAVTLLRDLMAALTGRWRRVAFAGTDAYLLASLVCEITRELGSELIPAQQWSGVIRERLASIAPDRYREVRLRGRDKLWRSTDLGEVTREALATGDPLLDCLLPFSAQAVRLVVPTVRSRPRDQDDGLADDGVGDPMTAAMGRSFLDWREHLLLGYLLRLLSGWGGDRDVDLEAEALRTSQWSLESAWRDGPDIRRAGFSTRAAILGARADWIRGMVDQKRRGVGASLPADGRLGRDPEEMLSRADEEFVEVVNAELKFLEEAVNSADEGEDPVGSALEAGSGALRGLRIEVLELAGSYADAVPQAIALHAFRLERFGADHLSTVHAFTRVAELERHLACADEVSARADQTPRALHQRAEELSAAAVGLQSRVESAEGMTGSSGLTHAGDEAGAALGPLLARVQFELGVRQAALGQSHRALRTLRSAERWGQGQAAGERLSLEIEDPAWVWGVLLRRRENTREQLATLAAEVYENHWDQQSDTAAELEDLIADLRSSGGSDSSFRGTWNPDLRWIEDFVGRFDALSHHLHGEALLEWLLWKAQLLEALGDSLSLEDAQWDWRNTHHLKPVADEPERYAPPGGSLPLAQLLLDLEPEPGFGAHGDLPWVETLGDRLREERAGSARGAQLRQARERILQPFDEWAVVQLFDWIAAQCADRPDDLPGALDLTTPWDSTPYVGESEHGRFVRVPHAILVLRAAVGPSWSSRWKYGAGVSVRRVGLDERQPDITNAWKSLVESLQGFSARVGARTPEAAILDLERAVDAGGRLESVRARYLPDASSAHDETVLLEKELDYRIQTLLMGLGGIVGTIGAAVRAEVLPRSLSGIGRSRAGRSLAGEPSTGVLGLSFDEGPLARILDAGGRGPSDSRPTSSTLQGWTEVVVRRCGCAPLDQEWFQRAWSSFPEEATEGRQALLHWCAQRVSEALVTAEPGLELDPAWVEVFLKPVPATGDSFYEWEAPLEEVLKEDGRLGSAIWTLDDPLRGGLLRLRGDSSLEGPVDLPPALERHFECVAAPARQGIWVRPPGLARESLQAVEIDTIQLGDLEWAIPALGRRAAGRGRTKLQFLCPPGPESPKHRELVSKFEQAVQGLAASLQGHGAVVWRTNHSPRMGELDPGSRPGQFPVQLGEWELHLTTLDPSTVAPEVVDAARHGLQSASGVGWVVVDEALATTVPRGMPETPEAALGEHELKDAIESAVRNMLSGISWLRVQGVEQSTSPPLIRVRVEAAIADLGALEQFRKGAL